MKNFKLNKKVKMRIKIISLTLFLIMLHTLPVFPIDDKPGVTVFVLDTGIDDIFVQQGVTFIDPAVSHGSIVSRIIKEEAPGVRLVSHSVAGANGQLREDYYLAGLKRVLNYQLSHPLERILVNVSLSFSRYLIEHHRLIKELYQAGVLVIAAAGNDGSDRPVYPAGFGQVVAVANADQDGKADSSNYGLHIDLSAPGTIEFITRVYFSGGVNFSNLKDRGSSFSAPRVSGLLARILLENPDFDPWEGLKIIEERADPISDSLFKKGLLGAGVINPAKALGGAEPFYHTAWFWPGVLILIVAIPGTVLLWKKYGIIIIFLIILFLLVGLPLIFVLLGNSFQYLRGMNLNLLAVSCFTGGLGAAFLLTGWRTGIILFAYGIFLILSLLSKPITPASYFAPFIVLFLIERILLFILNRLNRSNLNIYFLGSSTKLETSLRRKLTFQADRDKVVAGFLKKALLKTTFRRKKVSLIRVLVNLKEPPVDFLISFAARNKGDQELIIETLLNRRGEILPDLFKILQGKKREERWLVGDLLSRLARKLSKKGREKLVQFMIAALTDDRLDREIILLALADFQEEARQAIPTIIDLLQREKDPWLLFQALRTLMIIHPTPEDLLPLLEELSTEEPEPVSTEARELIREQKDWQSF